MAHQKEYFIFISYASQDIDWAEWLQDELEHYKLPATFNGRNDVRDNLRDVFRDRDELTAGTDWDEQVKQALANTSNLVVICSPDAAKSEAVDREIEMFIKQGKGDKIFPFIVSGNSPKECFPPSLSHKKIGGDVNKDGSSNKAFAKVVSGILGVEFDSIWQRYEQDKAKKEKELREQRNGLYRVQSRFLAEKAEKLINDGNSVRAALLMLNALPKRVDDPEDKPLVPEAERVLREAISRNTIAIKEDIIFEDFDGNLKNRTFLCNDRRGGIFFLNIDTGDKYRLYPDVETHIESVKYSPSGVLFACITAFNVIIYDYKSMSVLYRYDSEYRIADEGDKIAFSPDEKSLLIVHYDDEYIYDFEKAEIFSKYSVYDHVRKYYRENISKFSVALQEDEYYGKISGNRLKVIERKTGKCVAFTNDWFAPRELAAYNPYNKSIVYQRHDGTLCCLKIDDGCVYRYPYQPPSAIGAINFMPESNEMALLCNDLILAIAKYDNFAEEIPVTSVKKCKVSPDSKYAAGIICYKNGLYRIGIWLLETLKSTHNVPDYTIAVSDIKICNLSISPDSQTVAVHYVNNKIRFYSVHNGLYEDEYELHDDLINDMAYSPCGNYFTTASDDCTLKVWKADSKTLERTIKTHTPVLHFQYDNAGEYILTTNPTNVKLFSVETGKCIKTFKVDTNVIPAQFSPCHKYMVACSGNKVYVYDLSSGKCVNIIKTNDKKIEGFVFINDNGDYYINYGSYSYIGNIENKELERIYDYYGLHGMERSNDGEYILEGNYILKRINSKSKTSDLDEESPFGTRLRDFISMGYLSYSETSENDDMTIKERIDIVHNRFKLHFSKKSISVIDIESQEVVEEFGSNTYEESIVDASFSTDGHYIIYITDPFYSGHLKYRKEFKPIQTLIDETTARFSESKLTEEERKQCYLD